jgi:hypothetical protein
MEVSGVYSLMELFTTPTSLLSLDAFSPCHTHPRTRLPPRTPRACPGVGPSLGHQHSWRRTTAAGDGHHQPPDPAHAAHLPQATQDVPPPPTLLQPAGLAAPPLLYLAGQWASGVLNRTSWGFGTRTVHEFVVHRACRRLGALHRKLTLEPQASLAIRPAIWAEIPGDSRSGILRLEQRWECQHASRQLPCPFPSSQQQQQ